MSVQPACPRGATTGSLPGMGFMDKAKKMAEQAQAKLDEAQKQFNSGQQQGQGSGPVVEYDAHGRPIPQAEAAAPPHGDPLASSEAPPAPAAPPVTPAPPAPAAPPAAATPAPPVAPAPPAQPSADAPDEDRNHPSYAPPTLTSGDPLAG
jgi:hypothetical protein